MKREKRDVNGKVKDSLWQRFKSWRLGKKIRSGKLPRGRSAEEVIQSIDDTLKGNMAEIWGILSAQVKRGKNVEDLGVISVRKVTTAFRDKIVDSLQNSTTNPLDVFKYHGSGTGVGGESNADSALGTEVGTRATGSQEEGASANIFKTIGTVAYTNSYAVTEHGIFSASTSGTLMDRSVFSAINVVNGDSIQFTYQCTFNAEA